MEAIFEFLAGLKVNGHFIENFVEFLNSDKTCTIYKIGNFRFDEA